MSSATQRLIRHTVYLLLAFLFCSKAWLSSDLIIGGGDQPDWTGTAWAYWWTGYALTHGFNPFDGQWNFFPVGQRPLAQYNLLDALLAWPLLEVFGVRVGYNMFATLVIYSTAWAMDRLARTAGASWIPALYAGVALESSSFLLLEVEHGRLSQALLIFWLLGLAGFIKMAKGEASWLLTVLTGLAIAATSLTYWYWGLFLIFAATPIWIGEFWFWERKRFLKLGAAALICLVICGPYIYALAAGYSSLPGVGRELEPWLDYGSLSRGEFGLAMGIKQSHWPLWPLAHTLSDPDDKRIALVPLIIGIAAFFQPIPEKKRWIALFLIGYLLTLGPYLKWIDKEPFRIGLPFLWLYDHFPFFKRFWWPQRLELLALVALLIMGALQLERWTLFLHRNGKKFALFAIIGCLIDVPFRNPYLPIEAYPPREYKAGIYGTIKGPILTTPVLSNNEITRHLLWLQTFHEQPILGGLGDHISSHRPRKYESYIEDRVILNHLAQISQGTFQEASILPDDVDALLQDGFTFVVVDPATYSPGLEERWAEAFTAFFQGIWGEPTFQVGLAQAWKITPIPQAVYIENIPPVEHAGPRTEDGFIPHLDQ
ncbi:MAG: hypothetical protein CMK59_12350 [Proteobacteria bacterium]|nr:hypothetical protein [Pseudomonadota bacterium]